MVIFSEIRANQRKEPWGNNVEFLNVKNGGTWSNHKASNRPSWYALWCDWLHYMVGTRFIMSIFKTWSCFVVAWLWEFTCWATFSGNSPVVPPSLPSPTRWMVTNIKHDLFSNWPHSYYMTYRTSRACGSPHNQRRFVCFRISPCTRTYYDVAVEHYILYRGLRTL